jgi:general transcription factor IIIA
VKSHHTATSDFESDSGASTSQGDRDSAATALSLDINAITGNTYAARAKAQVLAGKVLQCPYPDLGELASSVAVGVMGGSGRCQYVFSRAYDLWRHLRTAHSVKAERSDVDEWVRNIKETI